MSAHVSASSALDAAAVAKIFSDARTHNAFLDKPVSDELLRQAVDIAKMGPTSVNQSPMRIVFLRSKEAKERLRPAKLFPRSPRFSFDQIAKVL